MKILIIGVGSIGMRHLKNIAALGHTLYAVDIDPKKLVEAARYTKNTFLSLDKALKAAPDAALICTLNKDHVPMAIKCAKAGCHLFIEKPLSLTLRGVEKLAGIIRAGKLISMVGCNMRLHPAIKYIHDLLTTNPAFRKRLLAELEFGYYLPFAKPDYRKSYQAKRKLGGNLIFDGIHELDYAVWFFGNPKKVFCTKGMVSGLDMDTEDHVEIIVEFESGVVCLVHMDYLQHGYSRRCKIICKDGTAVWDFASGKIGIITRKQKRWKWVEMDAELYYNKMYLDEIKYFLDSARLKKETFNSVESSVRVLELAIAANKSSISGRWELIKGEDK